MRITHKFNLNYRIWQGLNWAYTLLFYLFVITVLAASVTTILYINPVVAVANYLAQAPSLAGLPFQARLAALGGGLFILASSIVLIALAIKSYCYSKITPEDLDLQLTAIQQKLISIDQAIGMDNFYSHYPIDTQEEEAKE